MCLYLPVLAYGFISEVRVCRIFLHRPAYQAPHTDLVLHRCQRGPNEPIPRTRKGEGRLQSAIPWQLKSKVCGAITAAASFEAKMGISSNLRAFVAQDPVISAALMLSLVGLGLPLVVPPIRDAFSGTKPVAPPKLSEVVEGMTGKKQGSS